MESESPVLNSPIQSPAYMPGPLVSVAVTVSPAFAVVVLSAMVGGAALLTVIVALVATFTSESFRKNRTLYVPGVDGIVNWTDALVAAVAGFTRVPFRYFQS